MRTWIFTFAVACALACSNPAAPIDEGSPDAGPSDAAVNDGDALSLCLDRPGALPRPPTGRLPCELLPPGLILKQTR